MVEEFDKEMDILLRQAARGETAPEDSRFKIQDSRLSHLDADEISLFAEDALPKKLRQNAVVHFADCDRCRRILSDLISQNVENELVSAKQTEVFAPVVPWYRKLFAFPNLAYTLGALVLVFSGVVAFTVLQSVDNSQNAEMSQVSEQSLKGGPYLDDSAMIEEQNANAMMSSNTSNAPLLNTAQVSSPNTMMSNASTNSAIRSSNASSVSNATITANKSTVTADESPKDEPRREDDVSAKVITELPLQSRSVKNLTNERERAKGLTEEREHVKEDKSTADTTAVAQPAPPPKPEQSSVSENQVTSSDASSAKSKKMERLQSVETTSVGGKDFKRSSNAWVDSAYKGQATTNITRGTSEFKKLDSGLRGIAKNLGGTVIIVWKDKAYRIQ